MHELSIVQTVIDNVLRIADEQKLKVVGSVTLQIGEVSTFLPEYIEKYWAFAREKIKLLKQTEMKIEVIEAVTFCQDCKKTYSTVRFAKQCPYCQSYATYLVKGNEFTIKEIEAY